jgi:thymidylate kinase
MYCQAEKTQVLEGADGSGWAGVYNILRQKGYNVAVVQNPTKSLAEDVAFTKAAIDSLKSEVVLVVG